MSGIPIEACSPVTRPHTRSPGGIARGHCRTIVCLISLAGWWTAAAGRAGAAEVSSQPQTVQAQPADAVERRSAAALRGFAATVQPLATQAALDAFARG